MFLEDCETALKDNMEQSLCLLLTHTYQERLIVQLLRALI